MQIEALMLFVGLAFCVLSFLGSALLCWADLSLGVHVDRKDVKYSPILASEHMSEVKGELTKQNDVFDTKSAPPPPPPP